MFKQTDEELDPEDVELDEHYTVETRSKCKLKIDVVVVVVVSACCFHCFVHALLLF